MILRFLRAFVLAIYLRLFFMNIDTSLLEGRIANVLRLLQTAHQDLVAMASQRDAALEELAAVQARIDAIADQLPATPGEVPQEPVDGPGPAPAP